jgi:hypothetical protein
VKFGVLTVVKMLMIFWVVMPCEIDRYQYFREKYSLHFLAWPEDGDIMILHNASINI